MRWAVQNYSGDPNRETYDDDKCIHRSHVFKRSIFPMGCAWTTPRNAIPVTEEVQADPTVPLVRIQLFYMKTQNNYSNLTA